MRRFIAKHFRSTTKRHIVLFGGGVALPTFLLLFLFLPSAKVPADTMQKKDLSDSSQVVKKKSDSASLWLSQFERVPLIVRKNQILATLTSDYLSSAENNRLWYILSRHVNLRKIGVGDTISLFQDKRTKAVRALRMEKNAYQYVIAKIDTGNIFCTEHSLPVHQETRCVAGYITEKTPSVWVALAKQGESPLLSIYLSDIFDWSVDFFGIQRGDQFQLLFDALYTQEGKMVKIERIYAARFVHNGQEYSAYRFSLNGKWGYYNEYGQSMQRAFLKAPLNYRRISSRFSHSRFHPILKYYRPHHGVDYAAASGTPVRTIGDGRVIVRAYGRGAGNYIKIKHNAAYVTTYMHLRGFARGLYVGKHVRQGEVIGYVGSTGLSTGPHLDFRVHKNGIAINPLAMKSPPSHAIPDSLYQKFSEEFYVPLQLLRSVRTTANVLNVKEAQQLAL